MSDQPTTTTIPVIADSIADPAWIESNDLALLITLADAAQEFTVNWGLLGTNDAEQAGERLDSLANDLIPLLQEYDRIFPPTPADQRIPYTVASAI